MTSHLPVLLLYTSDQCSACERFLKDQWPNIKKEINGTAYPLHFSQPTMTKSSWNEQVPLFFEDHITAFPSLFLVKRADWNKMTATSDARKNKNVNVVYERLPKGKNIILWVNELAKRDDMKNTLPSVSKPVPPPQPSSSQPATTRQKPVIPHRMPTYGMPAVRHSECSIPYKLKKHGT